MDFRKNNCIIFAACILGTGTASAAVFNFANNGNGTNLGNSFSETEDGITVTVSAFSFNGENSSPSSAGATATNMHAWGSDGIGIGPGGNPKHTASNAYGKREFFLLEFDQLVELEKASISEWGNDWGSTSSGDSDVDYWAGAGMFDFDNLGTRFEDDIHSSVLFNGQKRKVDFDDNLGIVNWLLIGPEAYDANTGTLEVHDYLKLRKVSVSAVPVPAAVWLFGSGLLALVGISRRRRA